MGVAWRGRAVGVGSTVATVGSTVGLAATVGSTSIATTTGDDTAVSGCGAGISGCTGKTSNTAGKETGGTIDCTSSAAGAIASWTLSRTGVTNTPAITPAPASPAAPT